MVARSSQRSSELLVHGVVERPDAPLSRRICHAGFPLASGFDLERHSSLERFEAERRQDVDRYFGGPQCEEVLRKVRVRVRVLRTRPSIVFMDPWTAPGVIS